MIKEKLQKAINDQITAEMWSSQLYLQMSYFLKHQGWDGYAHWMRLQAEEEREHATRMADYMSDRGGIVKLQMIDRIVELTQEEKDYATENFFRRFVDEQVEEEATAEDIVEKLKRAKDSGIVLLDSKLGARVG